MNKLDQFIAWLLSWVNIAIYVWGGQGQTVTSEQQIRNMETSNYNALRAIALWIKRGRNAICFDCSGLLVKWLLSVGLIEYDTTADGLLHMCESITKSQLKRGDWVFRVRDGKAYHIGVVVDSELNTVESMGRDDGVVKRGLNQHSIAGYWNAFGRPQIFKAEIEHVDTVVLPIASAPSTACPYAEPTDIYTQKSVFSKNDALWFQWQLNRIGYKLVVDGIAGTKTKAAIWYEVGQGHKTGKITNDAAGEQLRTYLKSVPSK